MRVYLAGPDVFHPDALRIGAEKKAICAGLGLTGVFPFDESVPGEGLSPDAHGLAIAAKDFRLAASCDAAIVNLTPFHGPSMDVGTAVELGFLVGRGRPVWGYSNTSLPFSARVAAAYGQVLAGDGRQTTPDGMTIEPFGLADNLMVPGAIAAAGGQLLLPDDAPLAFDDLAIFARAVAGLASAFRRP